MIKVIPYKPEHLQAIELRECHSNETITEIHGSAMTFVVDESVLAIVGGFLLAPGVMQVWGLISDKVSLAPLSFHKQVNLLIQYLFESRSLRRMQMSVRRGYEPGWKWSVSLGFKFEGVMKKYGTDGSDYYLFARVA